jgi:hypothetical protein
MATNVHCSKEPQEGIGLRHITENNPAQTARILWPKERYFDGRTIKTVPKGFMGMYCEVCGHNELIPTRLGSEHFEMVRVHHLRRFHSSGLNIGTVVLYAQA